MPSKALFRYQTTTFWARFWAKLIQSSAKDNKPQHLFTAFPPLNEFVQAVPKRTPWPFSSISGINISLANVLVLKLMVFAFFILQN